MHDLGTIGRGQRAAISDGMKDGARLVARPWPWSSRSTRSVSTRYLRESFTATHRETTPRHPSGLYVVCLAELCERFAGCLLLSLLVLYLTERLDQPASQAIRWAGILNAAGYAAALGGGWLVGRTFSALRGAMLGAVLLTAGFVVLAIERRPSLLTAFALLTLGSGLFRAAIVLLLAQLYSPRDSRRDAGHTWFWTAVNIGGVLAPLAAGTLRAFAGWQAAFVAAALGMVLCVLVLIAGQRHLRSRWPAESQQSLHIERSELHPESRLRVLGAASLAAILYAAAYGQIDGLLLLWARDQTDRHIWNHEIPVAWFSSLPALLVLMIGPALLMVMNKVRSHGREPSALVKMTIGLAIVGVGYAAMAMCAVARTDDGSSPLWLLLCCATLVLGELLIVPIGLALVTRLFAHRYGGLGSGLWFAISAMGSWMGGEMGARGQGWPAVWFFAGLAGMLTIGAALIGSMERLGKSGSWELRRKQ